MIVLEYCKLIRNFTMHRYYNIHTHHAASEMDCLSVRNISADFHLSLADAPYSMGLHPWYLDHADDMYGLLQQQAIQSQVLAIGECGLDKVTGAAWDTQVHWFRQQIQLANHLNKPLIIHCVRAFNEVLQVLKEEQVAVSVIFHGFHKKKQLAAQILSQGYILSFGAALLKGNAALIDVLQWVPTDQFFLETDDADISIKELYHIAAQIRKTEEEAIILQLQRNFKNIFGV